MPHKPQGSFGIVCKAEMTVHYNHRDTVAVKMEKDPHRKGLKEEMQKLMGLRNQHILQYRGYSWMEVDSEWTFLLITEFMDRGSLCAPYALKAFCTLLWLVKAFFYLL